MESARPAMEEGRPVCPYNASDHAFARGSSVATELFKPLQLLPATRAGIG